MAQSDAEPVWSQIAGGPGHEGWVELPSGPLDVLSVSRVLEPAQLIATAYTIPFVETRGGLVGLAIESTVALSFPTGGSAPAPSACALIRVPDPTAADVVRGVPFPCGAGPSFGNNVVGYDAVLEVVHVCTRAGDDDAVLSAMAGDGSVLWSVTPRRLGLVVGSTDVGQGNAFCAAPAFDPVRRTIFVPVAIDPESRGRVAAIDADDGSVLWSRSMPLSPTVQQFILPAVEAAEEHGIVPYAAAVTSNGLLVVGSVTQAFSTAHWMDFNGTVVGAAFSSPRQVEPRGPFDRSQETGESEWPTASGARAATVFGSDILLVDPSNVQAASIPLDPAEPAEGNYFVAPRWWDRTVIVPLRQTVGAYDTVDLANRWVWDRALEWFVSDVLIVPPADVYVVAARRAADVKEIQLFRIDLPTGRLVGSLPLSSETLRAPADPAAGPASRSNAASANSRFLPIAGGRVVIANDEGRVTVLGPSPEGLRPHVELSDAYVPVAAELVLDVGLPPSVGRVVVAWDDDSVETFAPTDRIAHAYGVGGERLVRTTAVFGDNRTATTETPVHVGVPRPPELNFMQRAFAPNNQNATFAVIGVLVTLAGGAFAYIERRHRRGRLGEEIRELRRIRDRARTDLLGAIGALEDFHQRIETDHATGSLDDAQFGVLELRESRIRQALRARVLGALHGRVTPRFHQLLDLALEDGVMEPGEADGLRVALAEERNLSAEERERLGTLFERWAAERSPRP